MELRELSILFREKEKELCDEAKLRIANNIKEVERKIALISSHFDLKAKEAQRVMEEKLIQLKEEATRQLNKAVGLHTELKRKYDEFLWLQQFSAHVEEVSDAINCVRLK